MSSVPPADRPDEGPEGSAISDEELERFLREAAEGTGTPPKEPSARARMVARRLREEEPAPTAWRPGPPVPVGTGGRTRRRGLLTAVGVLIAALVAVIAVRPSLLLDRFRGDAAETGASPAPAQGPTRADPFRGSPAAGWAEGADAIVPPAARAVSGVTETEVARALRRTKEFLVAANLDPGVLRGDRPEKAIALLDPKSPGLLAKVERSLRAPDRTDDPLLLFTRFDPARARVLGDVVKVRGEMTVRAGEPGVAEVRADYTFVYPLVRAEGGDEVARTVVRRSLTVAVSDPDRWDVTEGKLLPKAYFSDFGNTACEVYDGYLHPSFAEGPATGEPATGPTVDPYDRSRPLTGDGREECGEVTRT
ncbi:hypothetical protein [Streptomyces fumanus]|uniref:hypothetical protein n=1 Tax=Streptomyces fumanus TaxID=67302 RepID=UPI00167DCFFF|nr:hypothetical protein [Streptomyces fumanus]